MSRRRPIGPKFLYQFHGEVPGPGDLIIHPRTPWCIGQVYHEGDKVRVQLLDWEEKMTDEMRLKMALEMKTRYYFTHVQPTRHDS